MILEHGKMIYYFMKMLIVCVLISTTFNHLEPDILKSINSKDTTLECYLCICCNVSCVNLLPILRIGRGKIA